MARITPALSLSLIGLCALSGQDLAALSRAYRSNPSPATRAPLAKFAESHSGDAAGAQALLALAATETEQADFAHALQDLSGLEKRLPRIADYVLYLRAAADYGAQHYPEAAAVVPPLASFAPASPVLPRAVMTAAHAYVDAKRPKDAVDLLRRYIDQLPSPQAMFLMAQAAENSGDPIAAATHYENVFYGSPTSPEAGQSETALERLRQSLGQSFPPAMPDAMLGRAQRLMTGGDPARARREFEAIATQVGGADRDLARVRIGEADYFARKNDAAYSYLKSLSVSTPEADAERLYYALAAARRLDHEDDARALAGELARLYPKSKWRLQGLMSIANHFLIENQPDQFEPMYQACADSFPADSQAPYCHWKYVWSQYIRRQPQAVSLLKEHLTRFPGSEKAAAALYFLGRSAERSGQTGTAKAYYTEIIKRFPNFYHAVPAAERLKQGSIASAAADASASNFVASVRFPAAKQQHGFTADAPSKVRVERARMLAAAGLDDWSDAELRFAAKTDSQPGVIAIEAASLAEARGAHDRAIRAIKSLAAGYLSLPFDAAPDLLWRLAFPMPYRSTIETYSREHSLDPYLVAALIRQESEFNPEAVSRAKAYGLTQVLPRTGREISRKVGERRFTANMLFEPETNIKLGTYYLRSLLDQFEGKIEPTLASYNGGKTNVLKWLGFAQFEEPAEFVETIPFTETRDYVQIVLRNAEVYRRLYGKK